MNVRLPTIAEPEAVEPPDDKLLRVGDVAQRTNKTVRALHLYEELGLLHPSERSKGGYRLYGSDAVVRVRWISKLQDMGFSLPDIREIVEGWEQSGSAPNAMDRVRALYREKLRETEAQIGRLNELKTELASSIAYLDTCQTCDPERLIHACTHCDLQHPCAAPDLVAGLHSQKQ